MPPMPWNCPWSEPASPNCLRYLRSALYSTIRLLPASATQMLPPEPTATAFGPLNLISPLSYWVRLVA